MSAGRCAFRPGWPLTLIALALAALAVRLGLWQLDRAAQAESFNALVQERARMPALDLDGGALPPDLRFRHVRVRGRFEADWQILLDNQVHASSAGVRVITPLKLAGSEARLLVDRGWLPLDPTRRQLPQPAAPAAEVEVSGVADSPGVAAAARWLSPEPGAQWGRLWPFLDLAWFERFSGHPVQPFVVREDPDASAGLARDWQPPRRAPSMHRGYAVQWFAFALIVLGVYAGLSVPFVRRAAAPALPPSPTPVGEGRGERT